MMLKRKITHRDGSGSSIPRRGSRAGSSVFAVLAGVAVVCAGTTAAALAGGHASSDASSNQCQVLPAPTSTATTPPVTPGGGDSSGSGSSPSQSANSTPPSSNPTEICIDVTSSNSSVHVGDDAYYSISVYPQGGTVGDVTVQILLPPGQSTPGLPEPVFNVCGRGDGTQVCTIGTMHDNQATQLQAEVAVPSKDTGGTTVTLAATATAAAPGANSTGQVTGSATVDVDKVSTSSGGGHKGGGSGKKTGGSGSGKKGGSGGGSSGSGNNGSGGNSTTSDTQPFDNLPPLVGSGDGTSNPGSGDSSNLFPTINPSSGSPGSGNGSHAGKAAHKPYKATTVADILPLNSGQISGQVAGLIVLALGILLVFARITLRKPRSSQGKD
jgi:hypothetical protein